MRTVRIIVVDLPRAALVLALLLSILGNSASAVSISPASGAAFAIDATAPLCGSGLPKAGWHHAPCHACRATDIGLPPPPCTFLRIPAIVTTVTVAEDEEVIAPRAHDLRRAPRGPPSA